MTIILDEISWVLDFFFNKTPRPIQIILFLLLLILIGLIISMTLHIIGVHCGDTKDGIKPIKIPITEVTTNFNILIKTIIIDEYDENFSYSEFTNWYNAPETSVTSCALFLYLTADNCYDFCYNYSNPACGWYYDEADCFDCSSVEIDLCGRWVTEDRCIGKVNNINWSWYQRYVDCDISCKIPEGYFFDADEGRYICNSTICLDNATNSYLGSSVTALLDEVGGELIYTEEKDNIDQIIKFSCDNNYNPNITFFSIPMFDYRYWVFLIIITIMFLFLSYIKSTK